MQQGTLGNTAVMSRAVRCEERWPFAWCSKHAPMKYKTLNERSCVVAVRYLLRAQRSSWFGGWEGHQFMAPHLHH